MTPGDKRTFYACPILVRPPCLATVREIMQDYGLHCVGGFPLYLMGGAAFYSDVDLYATSWGQFYAAAHTLRTHASEAWKTDVASHYRIGETEFSLTGPLVPNVSVFELMDQTDLSPCATALRFPPLGLGRGFIICRYLEDIQSRQCRVLLRHAWTDFRLEVYRRKGYTIVPEQEAPDEGSRA